MSNKREGFNFGAYESFTEASHKMRDAPDEDTNNKLLHEATPEIRAAAVVADKLGNGWGEKSSEIMTGEFMNDIVAASGATNVREMQHNAMFEATLQIAAKHLVWAADLDEKRVNALVGLFTEKLPGMVSEELKFRQQQQVLGVQAFRRMLTEAAERATGGGGGGEADEQGIATPKRRYDA